MIFNMRVWLGSPIVWRRAGAAVALAIGSVLLAQTQMNVEQLAEFVKSELALHQHSDKQIAAGVRQIQLSEKLTDKTIIDLQAQGAGPKTTEALKILRDLTANMKFPAHASPASPASTADQSVSTGAPTASLSAKAPPIPPPSSIRQAEIRQSMTDYALNYTKNLPNFFCVEVTRQYVDPNGAESYRSLGSILARVSYNEGQEKYSVYSVNSKLVDTTMDAVKSGGATSTGEFGSLMRTIFDPQSQAEFAWDHWATLRGRRMAVFSYFVDSAHSIWYIHYGQGKDDDQRIVTAYRGLIYADPNTGEIGRIKFEAVDIPRSFPVKETSEILDYDLVEISGSQFVVPLSAKLLMKAGRESTKNEIEFRNYRKFEAGSTIKYDVDPNATPPALPDSTTEEKPATTAPSKRENPWVLPTPPPPPPQ
jgi:hypothetical protein